MWYVWREKIKRKGRENALCIYETIEIFSHFDQSFEHCLQSNFDEILVVVPNYESFILTGIEIFR